MRDTEVRIAIRVIFRSSGAKILFYSYYNFLKIEENDRPKKLYSFSA